MKTKRLYYTDSNLLSFKSRIVETRIEDAKHITILEKTAFYPTSGGQLHDIGMLEKVPVIDVIDGNQILHVSESAIGKVGEIVTGNIDYNRRHKNKQQHSAQHILSQSFFRLYNLTTMSVHLGESYGNIEFDTKEISAEQLQKAEQLSNQVIAENRAIEVIMAHSDNLSKYNLRRPSQRTGEIRLISIDDFECTACGGTHVNATSEIQLIKIISTEKIRGRVAVNFLSGQQAIDDYVVRFEVTDSIAKKLTCSVSDVESHFDKFIEQNKSYKRELTSMQKELIPLRTDELIENVEVIHETPIVFAMENRFDKNSINQFATQLAIKCNGIAVLLYNDKIILSCADTLNHHAGNIAKSVSAVTSLRGGGNKNLAQLGGASTDDFDLYKEKIRECILIGNNENS